MLLPVRQQVDGVVGRLVGRLLVRQVGEWAGQLVVGQLSRRVHDNSVVAQKVQVKRMTWRYWVGVRDQSFQRNKACGRRAGRAVA